MNAFAAIVLDTWRQSRQQVVFMLLLLVLLVLVGCALFLPSEELPQLKRWEGKGGGSIVEPGVILESSATPRGVAAGDVDGDGDLDLVVCTAAAPTRVLSNDGQGAFGPGPSLDVAADAAWTTDLNGDERADLLLLSAGQGVTCWRSEAGSFAPAGPALGSGVVDVELADLDGDGDVDLVLAQREKPAEVWLNDGSAAFRLGATLGAGRRVDSGDVDGDGDLDLVLLTHGGVSLWLAGPQGYTRDAAPLEGEHLNTLVVADFDRDGKAELVVCGEVPRLYLRRGAGWERGTESFAGLSRVSRGFALDANEDGLIDLALVSPNESRVFLNTTREGYTEPVFRVSQQLPEGTTSALVLGHFDADRLLDAVGVAGERGLDLPVLNREWQDLLWQSTYGLRFVVFAESSDGPEGKAAQRARDAEAGVKTAERFLATTTYRRDVELLAILIGKMIFTFSMVLFIAACAGYFPGLLASGAVDIVLARPLSRLQIFMGKYIGGLVLYAAAISLAYVFLLLGFYARFGEFLPSMLLFVPIQVLAAAVLYAVLASLGILVRSSALPLLVGLFLFLGVDTALEFAIKFERAGQLGDWASSAVDWGQVLLPNFGLLKDVATFSVFGLQAMPAQPVVTACGWLVVFLGLGYWRFRTTDY